MPAPAEAINQQVIWKNDELRCFALSLIRHALASQDSHFTTDIVPDAERGTGTGIPGTVTTMLRHAGLIEPVGVTQGTTWYAHRILSTRPEAKSRHLNVYKLTSRAMAEEFLKRNGHVPLQQQLTLV